MRQLLTSLKLTQRNLKDMRQDDVFELLDHTLKLISEVEEEITKSVNKKEKLELYKPRIKSCMENLRSCLDYSVHDIYEKLEPFLSKAKTKNIKVYFPYGKNSGKARQSIHMNLPDLNLHFPAIFKLIESIQYHKSNKTWLTDLCYQTNNIKHNELTKQSKVESKNVKLFGGAINVTSSDVEISGNVFNGIRQSKDIIIKDNEIKSEIDGTEMDIIITDNLDFYFKDTSINILMLLKESEEEIREFAKQLYELLKKN
jgi:hypothetical protein